MINPIKIISVLLLVSVLSSCGGKNNQENSSNSNNETQDVLEYEENSSIENENVEEVETHKKEKFYKFKLTERGIFEEGYEIENVRCTTIQSDDLGNTRTISIELYEPKSETYNSFGFVLYPEKNTMKMSPGTFKITPFASANQKNPVEKNKVYIIGVIDQENYKIGLEKGLLDNIPDRFVLMDDKENILEIKSAEDTVSEKENEMSSIGNNMVTGQQKIKGNFTLNLIEISTKKEFLLEAEFEVIHDWGYLDEENN